MGYLRKLHSTSTTKKPTDDGLKISPMFYCLTQHNWLQVCLEHTHTHLVTCVCCVVLARAGAGAGLRKVNVKTSEHFLAGKLCGAGAVLCCVAGRPQSESWWRCGVAYLLIQAVTHFAPLHQDTAGSLNLVGECGGDTLVTSYNPPHTSGRAML